MGKIRQLSVFLLVLSLILAGCSGGSSAKETPPGELLPVDEFGDRVIAEGRVVPNQTVDLSFVVAGRVAEILVKEGSSVKQGDIIARLETSETLLAEIAKAERELLDANQAKDDLLSDVANARATTFQDVAEVYDLIRDTKYNLDNLTIPYDQRDLLPEEAAASANEQLEKARVDYEPCRNKPDTEFTAKEKNLCDDLREKLDDARSILRTATRRIQYESELMVAQARLDNLLADYETLQEGPDPAELKAIEARITADEAALVQAQAALKDLQVAAPFDGSIVDLDLIIGQQVNAGEVFTRLADFSNWYVETGDLTELKVVQVVEGQRAAIMPDALPDLELQGTVEQVSQVFEEKRGDITYTARIHIDEVDPRIRWGMTVLVVFK